MKGKLFIIEGGDGSGKATQTRLLTEHLQRDGYDVKSVSYPDYDSDSSALVKMYLRGDFGSDADAVNPYAASAFFAVDRFASYQMKWKAFYEQGGIVIADRYTTSNMLYQMIKIDDPAQRRAYLAWLEDFEFRKMGLPAPDKVFLLDVPWPSRSGSWRTGRARPAARPAISTKRMKASWPNATPLMMSWPNAITGSALPARKAGPCARLKPSIKTYMDAYLLCRGFFYN